MSSSEKHKLLVIDDSSLMRSALALVLAEAGFETKTAANVEEFENLLGEWWPDTILSDVQMPDMSGDDLCRSLKSRLLVRVVLFSNVHPERLEELAKNAGADGFISKLDGFERLPQSLWNIINRTREAPEEPETASDEPATPCKILLVDDTELGREVTGTILAREGFDVRIAGSLAEAADVLASWEPDLVLTPPTLENSGPNDICMQIEQNTGTRRVPIVIYGDRSSDKMTALAAEAGAYAGLSKLEGYASLLGKLHSICRER